MKFQHFFMSAAMLVALAACSDDANIIVDEEPEANSYVVASIETLVGSRASIDQGKVNWTRGDAIGVLLNGGSYGKLTLDPKDHGSATGTFKGMILGTIANNYHAYYPYEVAASASSVNLPASYDNGDDMSNSHVAMKATISDGALLFKHLCSVLRFQCKDVPEGASQFVFTVLDGQSIAGEFNIATDSDNNEYVAAASGTNSSVTVNFTSLDEKSDIEVLVPVPVGTYTHFRIAFKNSDDEDVIEPGVFESASFSTRRAVITNIPVTCVEITAGTAPGIQQVSATQINVTSAAGMSWIAQQVADGNDFSGVTITLSAHSTLDMSSINGPIADTSRKDPSAGFKGVLDGNGAIITGLNITNNVDEHGAGLIGVVNGGTVKNLTIQAPTISAGTDCAGAVVGVMLGESTIENCHVEGGTIYGKSASAGVVGRAYGSNNIIRNCTSSAAVTGASKVGGIVGITSGATTVTGCTNTGTVTGGNAGVGGIIGYGNANCTISDCTNKGQIGTINDSYSGGILGYQQGNNININNCSNIAEITGINAGGIFGAPGNSGYEGIVSECANSGAIVGRDIAGGILGTQSSFRVVNCSNTATVTATANNGQAGGVIGFANPVSENYAWIENCSGGKATISATYAGRLLGSFTSSPNKYIKLYVNDTNGDDYSSLRSIAIFTPGTAHSLLSLEAGTLHGVPEIGGNTAYIRVQSGAQWDVYPGETGTWYGNHNTKTWTKQN